MRFSTTIIAVVAADIANAQSEPLYTTTIEPSYVSDEPLYTATVEPLSMVAEVTTAIESVTDITRANATTETSSATESRSGSALEQFTGGAVTTALPRIGAIAGGLFAIANLL